MTPRQIYYAENREVVLAKQKAYWQSLPEEERKRRSARKKPQSVERARASQRKYYLANKDKKVFGSRARQQKAVATPVWDFEFDELVISEAYDLASRRTGFWEIDHIVPLRGRTVSGLHNGHNVQVVPRSFNRSKGNKTGFDRLPFGIPNGGVIHGHSPSSFQP